MKNPRTYFLALFGTVFLTACSSGTIENTDTNPNIALVEGVSAVMFGTDYGSGKLFTTAADLSDPSVSSISDLSIGSSAALASDGTALALVNDGYSFGSFDNVLFLDPTANFAMAGPFSLNAGAGPVNPVAGEIVGDSIYISLYNGESEPELNIDDTHAAHVVKMNRSTHEITERFSFSDYIDDTIPERVSFEANPWKMARFENYLLVLMQDLDFGSYPNYAPADGKIVFIDTDTDEVTGVEILNGRNPSSIAVSESNRCAFVSQIDTYDLTSFHGGLDILCVEDDFSPRLNRFIDDESLGGLVEKVVVSEASNKVLIFVSNYDENFHSISEVIALDLDQLTDPTQIPTVESFFAPNQDIDELTLSPDNKLWISHRSEDDPTSAKVTVCDADLNNCDTDENPSLAVFKPELWVTSIVFVNTEAN